MKVAKLEIQNIMGIEHLEIVPGEGVTVIEGANAAGKTSIVEALKAVIGGGHDATLLRQGADAGKVVVVFEDGMEVTKTITPTRSALTAKDPTKGRISAPATWLKAMTDDLWSPVAFLNAGRDRVKMLLEAVPMPVDQVVADKIADAIGPDWPGVKIPGSTAHHALHAIAAAHDACYRMRTGENRVAREAMSHVEQLAGSLPPGEDDGDRPDVGTMKRELAALREGMRTALDKADVDRRTREVALRADFDRAMRESAKTYEDDAARIRGEATPELEALAADIAAATEVARVADQHANTRAIIAHNRDKGQTAKTNADSLTAALRRLDALRDDLIGRFPVPGMEIRDGEVCVDGIPFHRLNRAAQVRAAIAVAQVRAGDVPLVVFDGFECLDTAAFEAFATEIEAAGLQAIVTRVTDGPLMVTPNRTEKEF